MSAQAILRNIVLPSVLTLVVMLAIIWLVPHDKPQTFKEWFGQHQPTCDKCSSYYDENGLPGTICDEAMDKMIEALERGEEI